MTIQKAIESMKNIVEYWTWKPTEVEAAKLAIDALEKQMPSSKSYEDCQYCGGDVNMRDYLLSNGDAGVYIDGNGNLQGDDEFYFEELKLSYCPMCGGKFD